MSQRGEVNAGERDDFEAWTTMKALIDAHRHSMNAMEQYTLQATNDEIDLSAAEYEASLEEAIESHRRAIEQLEFALEPNRSE
jgi:hypothetical protein